MKNLYEYLMFRYATRKMSKVTKFLKAGDFIMKPAPGSKVYPKYRPPVRLSIPFKKHAVLLRNSILLNLRDWVAQAARFVLFAIEFSKEPDPSRWVRPLNLDFQTHDPSGLNRKRSYSYMRTK